MIRLVFHDNSIKKNWWHLQAAVLHAIFAVMLLDCELYKAIRRLSHAVLHISKQSDQDE